MWGDRAWDDVDVAEGSGAHERGSVALQVTSEFWRSGTSQTGPLSDSEEMPALSKSCGLSPVLTKMRRRRDRGIEG